MNVQDWKLIVVLSIACMMVLAVFFVVCRRYEDGIVGNIALGVMGFVLCPLLLWDAMRGTLEVPSPVICLLIASVALFMVRHAWRMVMFHWADRLGWAKPRDSGETTVRMKAIR